MKYVLAGVLALAAAAPVHAQTPQTTVDAILAANHAAVGDAPSSGMAQFDYAYSGAGLTGTRRDVTDLAQGAFVSQEEAQGIADAHGYDGRTPWQRDISGASIDQEGGDRIPVAISEAYRYANLWWRPDHGGASITLADRDTLDGRACDHLVVTPRGGKSFDAWFDAATHLLTRIAEDQQFFHTRVFYSDYRPVSGIMLPHAVVVDEGAGEAGYDRLTLTRFNVTAPAPLTTYGRPNEPLTGVTLDDGAASVTVPFRLLNNHIYVQARVNGKGPYTFIVDTGGHTLVSPTLISALGLKAVGAAPMTGAGEKTATSGFVQVDEIAVGGLRLRDKMAFAANIYKPAIEGVQVDGMIGFEVFRRMAVRIDYGRQTLTFFDPARFEPVDAGTAIPFVFYDHLPMIRGLIDDLPARFDIDTGSRSELDVTGPFVAAYHLRDRFPKGVSAVTGWGVGGPSRSYTVRLPSLTLGGVRVENPTAGLSEDKHGSISDPNYDGNVGSGFLKRFVVTFDYAHQVMYLKPIVPAPIDAGRFDRSGMWINAQSGGYEVVEVTAGGPAAQAGLAVGDVITSLDGHPTKPDGLSDARILLKARLAGSSVQAVVKRGGETRTVTLVLRDQI
jgi:hypothetical protein